MLDLLLGIVAQLRCSNMRSLWNWLDAFGGKNVLQSVVGWLLKLLWVVITQPFCGNSSKMHLTAPGGGGCSISWALSLSLCILRRKNKFCLGALAGFVLLLDFHGGFQWHRQLTKEVKPE